MRIRSLLLLCALSYCGSALWIKPEAKLQWLRTRSDPSIISTDASNPSINRSPTVLKRTDPGFFMGDFPKTPNQEDEKALLQIAFPDIYTLVWVAINKFDATVFNRWFPPEDKDKVLGVYKQIIDDPSKPIAEIEGNDVLSNFFITPVDTEKGQGNDLCAQGAAAYTKNYNPTDGGANLPNYAVAHFCSATFVDAPDEDGEQTDVPPKLEEIALERFFFSDSKSYRVTNEMEPIAATILHEIIHFNTVGEPSGLDDPDDFGARIGDEGGPNPDVDYGDPYWAAILRGFVEDGNDPCLNNADNYVWYALEMYWTDRFKESLLDQGGYFEDPKDPRLP